MSDIGRPHCPPMSRNTPKTYLQVINLFQFHGLPSPPTGLRDEIVMAFEWAWYGVEAAKEIERLRKALEPFANKVFNDNCDISVNVSVDADDLINAYFVLRRAALTEAKVSES